MNAYFEDHSTDPDKVILRKPRLDQGPDYERGFIDGMMYQTQTSVDKAVNAMSNCPNCEYHRQRAQRWREEAYKQSGHPLPEREDDHALIDAGLLNSDLGMFRTRGTRTWVGLTEEEILKFQDIVPNTLSYDLIEFARAIEAKLKEKNT